MDENSRNQANVIGASILGKRNEQEGNSGERVVLIFVWLCLVFFRRG